VSLKNQPFPVRLGFAFRGLAHALRTERSVQLQVVAAVVVLLALLKLRPSWGWWALCGMASAGVIAAELLNTAIEGLADHLHPELHPSIRLVKDCAAAAVLVAVLGALGVACALAVEILRQGH
jgi:diacylglycerol kinase (ATP)